MCPTATECATPTPALGAVVWAVVVAGLLAPVLAWLLATAVVGPGGRPRSGRGAAVLGGAVAVTAGLLVAWRLLGLAVPSLGGGPFAWLDATGLTSAGKAATAAACCVPPRGTGPEAAALLGALEGYLLALVALVMGARQRGATVERAYRVPAGEAAGWVLVAGGLALLLGAYVPLVRLGRDAALLDAVGFLPVAALALALWVRARYEPDRPVADRAPAQAAPAPVLDAPAVWRQLGALGPEARPLFSAAGGVVPAGAEGPAGPGEAAELWRLVGASGPPPGALDELARLEQGAWLGQLVGDLPDPTERAFVCAAIVREVLREGAPVLVVTETLGRDVDGRATSALRDAVEAAVRSSGLWSAGPLVVGEQELREAIAGQRLPAAAFLDVAELSTHGLRALWGPGALWARAVGLVVVPAIDRGSGLDVTHRMHTLRRLGLALRAAGARWSVLATGFGGVATRSLLEQSFAGLAVREVAFGPRASAAVQVWAASDAFVRSPGASWERRAIEPLVRAGQRVAVGDPLGSLDLRSVEVEVGRVALVRDVSFGGDASVSHLDDSWMLAGFRALPHRLPTANGQPHHALWGLAPSPVARYLLRAGTLAGLAHHGRVPAPRPLVGYGNRLLARAHLLAALREGTQDLDSLVGIFGRSLVEQTLGDEAPSGRHALRSVPSQPGLRRVTLAPTLPADESSPLRTTVTEAIVRVVHRHGGRPLLEVDRMVAETRYYPGRVFALGAERYEVPLHAFDAKRGEIAVEAVDETRSLTAPQLAVQVADAQLAEALHEVRSGVLAYTLGAFEVTAREQVNGVREASGRVTTYAPVSAQYRTRLRGIFFAGASDARVLGHLATSVEGVLLAHLLAADDDLTVVPLAPGLVPGLGAGVGVVDRHVQGMGTVEALDSAAVDEVLAWVRAILRACPCAQGCAECTAPTTLAAGPDKAGVLRLLGG